MDLSIDRSIRHWWVFVLRGALFIIAGIYMISSPLGSFAAFGFLFGLLILIAGFAELFRVVRDNDAGSRAWHLMLGLIDIILGIVLTGHIAASETILRIVVGIWILIRAISLFGFARGARSTLLMVGAILIAIFGLLVMFNAVFGTVTIVLLTGIAFVVTGIFNIVLGLRLK